ncbi:MAG: hypothetical protein ACHQ0J_07645 [Candidatus Dormibacterales bacterium]
MGVDAEGYGFPEGERTLTRLVDDVRVLSPAGVERVAMGWTHHTRGAGREAMHEAEKAAIHAVEKADRGAIWDQVRKNLFGLTESGSALVSWRAEHGEVGHRAESAAFMAALALVAGRLISEEQAATLLRPLAEALPWLAPGQSEL